MFISQLTYQKKKSLSLNFFFLFFLMIFCYNFLLYVSSSPIESPTRQVDPLLNSYSDYEDSVYGNDCNPLVFHLP